MFDDYSCGNCGRPATHGIRVNGPKDLSVWMLVLVPTGARVEAFLCRECLTELVNVRNEQGEGVHYAFSVPHLRTEPSHRSSVQRRIKQALREMLG
jgi:hypothetical protein